MDDPDLEALPLVSVVLPCYNYGHLLTSALDSVFRQTYQMIHVVVVDDGSTDGTRQVVASYPHDVEYVAQPNRGLPSARNVGAAHATGTFLLFLDPDDILEPTYIEECLGPLLDDPTIAYTYTQVRFFGDHEEISKRPEFSLDSLKQGNFVHASALLRTELVRRFEYDPRLTSGWEDWNFYLTLGEYGYFGKLVDKPLLNYRRHAASMTRQIEQHPIQRRQLRLRVKRRHPRLFPRIPLLKEWFRILGSQIQIFLRRSREAVR